MVFNFKKVHVLKKVDLLKKIELSGFRSGVLQHTSQTLWPFGYEGWCWSGVCESDNSFLKSAQELGSKWKVSITMRCKVDMVNFRRRESLVKQCSATSIYRVYLTYQAGRYLALSPGAIPCCRYSTYSLVPMLRYFVRLFRLLCKVSSVWRNSIHRLVAYSQILYFCYFMERSYHCLID